MAKYISNEVFDQLKLVGTANVRSRSFRYFPDFLVLGPQRTGTTWLAKILWRHPQVFMSFPKEVYFFNLLRQSGHPFYRSNELRWYLKRFHDNPATYAAKMALALSTYRELYRPVVRGEATASYAAMAPEVIAEIVALNPAIRAIVMVRDPITRAWSHAKKDLVRSTNRSVQDVPDEEFERFFRDPYQIACGNYTAILRNWSQALKPGNLFIGRFDEIETDPASLLRRILAFLNVSTSEKYLTEYLHVRVNTTEDTDIPENFRQLLRTLFAEELCRIEGENTLSACSQ